MNQYYLLWTYITFYDILCPRNRYWVLGNHIVFIESILHPKKLHFTFCKITLHPTNSYYLMQSNITSYESILAWIIDFFDYILYPLT